MEISLHDAGPVAVVALRGKITLGEASQNLRNQVDELVSGGKSQIVLNLADVPFIDSAGLGALTVGYTRTKAAGGLLKIAAVQPRVRDALEMTRLTRMFTLYATVQEAIESFAVGA